MSRKHRVWGLRGERIAMRIKWHKELGGGDITWKK